MGIVESLLKQFSQEAIVISKVKLSDAAYHITIKGDSIKTAEFTPGYFLRMAIGINNDKLSFSDFVRSYSVWAIDQTEGTIEIAIATHSKGAGAEWITKCKAGDTVYFTWKKGNFIIDDSADSYLMIGDLSALSHLYMIRRNLSKDKKVKSILYSDDIKELYPDMDGALPFDFYEMPQNPDNLIIDKVKTILPEMTGRKQVYIAGDSRVCVSLTHYFRKELKWETKQIKTKPFWNPDKKGLE